MPIISNLSAVPKSRDLVQISCDHCSKEFTRPKNQVQQGLKKGRIKVFCSYTCLNLSNKRSLPKFTCQKCSTEFSSKVCRGKPPRFCSRSCSNSAIPRKERCRPTKICTKCGGNCANSSKTLICRKCGNQRDSNLTLKDIKNGYSTAQYHAKIRGWSRSTYIGAFVCQYCNYASHVDVCHIKPISSFSMDSLISEVNSPNNLTTLCPNHHWEFDHGILSIDQIKLGSTG